MQEGFWVGCLGSLLTAGYLFRGFVPKKCRHLNREGADIGTQGGSFQLSQLIILRFLRHNHKQWVELGLDIKSGEMVGCYVGDRSGEGGACGLWQSLQACVSTKRSAVAVFGQHMSKPFLSLGTLAVSKKSGKTSLIERFNCTLRQRVSRLVRDTLSFSKKLDNHIGAIRYFIHSYNSSLLV